MPRSNPGGGGGGKDTMDERAIGPLTVVNMSVIYTDKKEKKIFLIYI